MKMFPRQDERHRVIQLMLFIRTNTARRLSASLIVSLPLRFLRSGAENLRWSQTENNKGIPFFHSDEIARQRPTNKTVMRKNNPMCRDNGGEGEWEGLLVACFRLLCEVSEKFESSSPPWLQTVFRPECHNVCFH